MRPHAFSIRTGSRRGRVQMGGLSLSLGPIHLSFLASPLCPHPFFQLPIHLPLATQHPSAVSHCSWVDLGKEAPTSQVTTFTGRSTAQGSPARGASLLRCTRAAVILVQASSGAGCFLWDTLGPPVGVSQGTVGPRVTPCPC